MPTGKYIVTERKQSLRRRMKGTRKLSNSKRKINDNKGGGLAAIIAPTFLTMVNTVKLYHWKTTSYSTHKATDDLYAKMGELTDKFMEVMLGKEEMGGRGKLLNNRAGGYTLNLSLFSSNNEFKKQIEHYKSFLINLSKDAKFNLAMNVDLMAIRDELLAELNQFLYLLSLN